MQQEYSYSIASFLAMPESDSVVDEEFASHQEQDHNAGYDIRIGTVEEECIRHLGGAGLEEGHQACHTGHYKGIDYRIRERLITKEVSIGDFVLTGGELAAACMTDAIVRVIPGAIGDEQSALSDSFQDNLLAAPVYTRPADYNGWKVPEILLSGHEAKIKEWELQQAFERTKMLRPDLLKKK